MQKGRVVSLASQNRKRAFLSRACVRVKLTAERLHARAGFMPCIEASLWTPGGGQGVGSQRSSSTAVYAHTGREGKNVTLAAIPRRVTPSHT